jgi:hypothetical protein
VCLRPTRIFDGDGGGGATTTTTATTTTATTTTTVRSSLYWQRVGHADLTAH